MRERISAFLLFGLFSLSAPCYSQDSAPTLDDLIVWEVQHGKPGSGYKRLTLWRDGYSESEIAVTSATKPRKPKAGWEIIREGKLTRYIHRYAYSPKMTRTKFSKALRAGIKRLKAFKPSKSNNRTTRIVISLDGKRREVVIPEFTTRNKGTLNHRRFLAVEAVLDGFDINAYKIPGAKPATPNKTADKSADNKATDAKKPATTKVDAKAPETEKPSPAAPGTETSASETPVSQ